MRLCRFSSRPTGRRLLSTFILLLGAAVGIASAAWTVGEEKQSSERAKTKANASDKEAAKGEKADPFAVPDGSPEELIKYIKELVREEPKAADAEGVKEFNRKLAEAVIKAGDRILAAQPKPTEAQAQFAARAKMEGYDILSRLGDKEAVQKAQNLPADLQKAGWPQIARLVTGSQLNNRLSRLDPEDTAEFKKLFEEVKKYLSAGKLQANDLQLAMMAGMAAEQINRKLAGETYQQLGKIVATAEDKRVASFGAKMEGAARRLNLIGNTMALEGATLAGKPLDWDKYGGKVVLVDFWATWCGPCVKEIPSIRKAYDAYHDKGFDVVGISLDEDREALESFVKENKLPWTVVVDHAAETEGKDQSMSTQYGVFAIPQMILVGKDGKVVSDEVRGPALERQLEKLLGPVEKGKKEGGAAKEEK